MLFSWLFTNICSGSQLDSDYAAVDKACYAGSANSIIIPRVLATIQRAYVIRNASGYRGADNFNVSPGMRWCYVRPQFPVVSEVPHVSNNCVSVSSQIVRRITFLGIQTHLRSFDMYVTFRYYDTRHDPRDINNSILWILSRIQDHVTVKSENPRRIYSNFTARWSSRVSISFFAGYIFWIFSQIPFAIVTEIRNVQRFLVVVRSQAEEARKY